MIQAHRLDGLVLISNCDKITPGMLMAAARIDIPAIIVTGGAMAAGRHRGKKVGFTNMFEAMGKVDAGKMTEEELLRHRKHRLPRMRLLQRHVHRQHHGMHDRSIGFVATLLCNLACKQRIQTANSQSNRQTNRQTSQR